MPTSLWPTMQFHIMKLTILEYHSWCVVDYIGA